MTVLLRKALEVIHLRTNLAADLCHPNNLNAAKELFLRLYLAGEKLLAAEIEDWARSHGWRYRDAVALGALAQGIGSGNAPAIMGGPWWQANILETLSMPD